MQIIALDNCLHVEFSSVNFCKELTFSLFIFQCLQQSISISHRESFCHLLAGKMEKAMAPHSSTLAWKIPWMEEPGGLQSMGSRRVKHGWATSLSLSTFMHWRRKWQPTPVFFPGESQGLAGTWWAAIYGVAQSWTQLKQLSSSSSGKEFCF